jgi:dTMP kinase
MAPTGKLIAVEGIDGAGKRTQIEHLTRVFTEHGIAHLRVSFPQYESFFGRMVARYLNGEFGALGEVDPHFSALLYAGDRLEARPALEAALAEGKCVLADRYIGSNLAHQTARATAEQQEEFLGWLTELEYTVYGLPRENLVIYLRVPPAEAQRLVAGKGRREYTKLARDLQEVNLAHLDAAARVYDRLASGPGWVTIDCFDERAGRLRSPEEIHREVFAAIRARFPELVREQERA